MPHIKRELYDKALNSSHNDAHASNRQPKRGTMMTIIAQFKASADYEKLSQSSKRAYLSYLKPIENEFGDLPVAALSDRRVRGNFKAWRDSFSTTPRKADYAWTTLTHVMSFAKDRSLIDSIHASAADGCTRPIEPTAIGKTPTLTLCCRQRRSRSDWP